ncbi:MAG: hypothetical protein J7L38_08260 [Thermoproteales archaeon]|nr:hypothetical protein [Thermoproteales archaeon]
MKGIRLNKKAIVGIEAAIVMIAFVVIAAAFAFMVVNMGLYSTQRSQESIQQGLKEASCPLTVDGSILLKTDENYANNVSVIIIPLKTMGVKYVPMWQNETTVSIKIGKRVAVANIYAGINHTINPTLMTFDSIISNLTGKGGHLMKWWTTMLQTPSVSDESVSGTFDTTGGSGTLAHVPIVPGTVTITATNGSVTETFTDNGNGTLTGSSGGSGTINYETGAVTLTFGQSITSPTVTASYQYYVGTRTGAVLVIQNDNGDDSLDFYEKGYLIIILDASQRAQPRDNVLVEIRPEKSAPLSISFVVPEAIPADSYVTLD